MSIRDIYMSMIESNSYTHVSMRSGLQPPRSHFYNHQFSLNSVREVLCVCVCVHVHAQLYPTLCSPPGSSVHGICQARILKWVATSSSRGSSQPRDQTHISCISCTGRLILYHYATWEAQEKFYFMSK